MHSPRLPTTVLHALSLAALLAIGTLIYLPGRNAPFLFDDYANLVENHYLRIKSLDAESILVAAYSQQAGPLQRPVAMASFALNSYFAGGFASPAPYRLVNIAIHLLNGALVYYLLRLIIDRYRVLRTAARRRPESRWLTTDTLAIALAFVWLVHPINLTSVLYIVQRMTSLSALFVLLALVSYFHGRARIKTNRWQGYSLLVAGVFGFGALGVLTKENALLLPLFIATLDFLLFRNEQPWKSWKTLAPAVRRWILGGSVLLLIMAVFWATEYALPGYRSRDFTMWQRLLTESRVLVTYLSLIVLPRLDALGMFHDDIGISHSIIDPSTTLLAILLLVGLAGVAIVLSRRAPLVALGIVWFFAAHLIESTILSLEIAHEHRNYLASLALPLVLAGLALEKKIKLEPKWRYALIIGFGLALGTVTYLRASQWVDERTLYATEVRHHPESARANEALGRTLVNQGNVSEGFALLHRAVALDPSEPGTLINIVLYSAATNRKIEESDLQAINERLASHAATASTQRALMLASDCVLDKCQRIASHMALWVRRLLQRNDLPPVDRSYYYQFLGRALTAQGRFDEAIDAYRASYKLDPEYLVPLIDIAQVYLASGRPDYAQAIASELRRANATARWPRKTELQDLESLIAKAKEASS